MTRAHGHGVVTKGHEIVHGFAVADKVLIHGLVTKLCEIVAKTHGIGVAAKIHRIMAIVDVCGKFTEL